MGTPRALIIPFGVPAQGRGLGLGLGALVHTFARVEGEPFALAQLQARPTDRGEEGAPPQVVEGFVAPQAWKELSLAGHVPPGVMLVVSGAFEPPAEGRGLLQLLAYDGATGAPRARVEAHVDVARAGENIAAAFEELLRGVGGDLGFAKDVAELAWEPLESVLRAERCALFDQALRGPHDRLAALVHLGRAVEEAPEASFPAGRLSALALEAVMGDAEPKLAQAARRALARAVEDAPTRLELAEAIAAVELRAGEPAAAEERMARLLSAHPDRARSYALLSEARRARQDLEGAMGAIRNGLARAPNDPTLLTENGAVLLDRGDDAGAEASFRRALDVAPLYPSAFTSLAGLVLRRADAPAAELLVDRALAAQGAHPEVLKKAIQLCVAHEPDGMPRSARLAKLGAAVVERVPGDAWGWFVLARAEAALGDREAARTHLAEVERHAPESAIAAEAQRGRFTLREPQAALEVESLLRAAYAAAPDELEALAARGRRLAQEHPVWPAFFALGVVERRRERWYAARLALADAVAACPGCTPAHIELVAVAVALHEPDAAMLHAARTLALEGSTARALSVHATALLSAGRRDDAEAAVTRALALEPDDAATRALAERIRQGEPPTPGPLARVRDSISRWLKPK